MTILGGAAIAARQIHDSTTGLILAGGCWLIVLVMVGVEVYDHWKGRGK